VVMAVRKACTAVAREELVRAGIICYRQPPFILEGVVTPDLTEPRYPANTRTDCRTASLSGNAFWRKFELA